MSVPGTSRIRSEVYSEGGIVPHIYPASANHVTGICTQLCKFMSNNLNFAHEISREGGGERASAAQQKSARFHGLPDSEIYTTEYI